MRVAQLYFAKSYENVWGGRLTFWGRSFPPCPPPPPVDRTLITKYSFAYIKHQEEAHEQSHIIAHSQGLTNGLSDRDYRVLTTDANYA